MSVALLASAVFAMTVGCSSSSGDDRPTTQGRTESGDREGPDYFGKILIKDVAAEAGSSGGSIREPMALVRGEIKNTGERSLDMVRLAIYFLDANGKRVHEDSHIAVLVGGTGSQSPLRPNYSRPFRAAFMKIPSDWSGKVEVSVSEVRFSPGTDPVK